MVIVTLILALAIAIVAVGLAQQNPEVITLTFFGQEWTDSLTIILIIVYAAGLLTGAILLAPGSLANRAKLGIARRKLDSIAKTAEKEKVKEKEPA
jgi:uncharacterized membrane protein YciS (DUF1049 family)